MAFTLISGAALDKEQKLIYLCDATGTIPDDADGVVVSAANVTLTLPLHSPAMKSVKVFSQAGSGNSTLVQANAAAVPAQTLAGTGAGTVLAQFFREYVATGGGNWVAAALS